ncbi:MAG TPA: PorV/PorQ family protein [Elusimicrobiota bacterium]|nr:PorV/PorQ family protein [Elusimicrobiota bacterium]
MDIPFQSLKNRLTAGGRRAAVLGLFLLVPGTLIAAKIHPKAGTTSAAFLKIAPGARAVSMGESFAALADDATALYWNPAGIVQLDHPEFTLMHNESFQDLRFVFAGYVHPLSPRHAFGVSTSGLFVKSDLERRSGLGENIAEDPLTESEGSFGAHDIAMAFSYARRFGNDWMAGGTVKGVQQVIDGERAQGAAADLGVLWRIPHSRWQAAAVIQHIGPPIRFIGKSYKLPLNGKLGVSWRPASTLRLTGDLNQSIDNYLRAGTGLEYDPLRFLSLRVGYKHRLNGNELGELSGLTAGCGFSIRGYSIDYAFNPAGDLGNTHRVSLTARFGGGSAPGDTAPATTGEAEAEEIDEGEESSEGPVPFRLSLKRRPTQKNSYRVEAESQKPSDVYRLEFNAVLSSTAGPMNLTVLETDDGDLQGDDGQNVYRLVTLQHNFPATLKDITVHFRVKKEWLRLRKARALDIRLIRVEGTRRIPKAVQITGENDEFVSFTGVVSKEGPFLLGIVR